MTLDPTGQWTEPEVLYPMSADNNVPKVVANKLLVLSTGEWILPFWRQKSWKICETKKEFNAAGVLRSDDRGATWQVSPTVWVKSERSDLVRGAGDGPARESGLHVSSPCISLETLNSLDEHDERGYLQRQLRELETRLI